MSANAPGKFIPGQTLDRGRRCQNCIHFDNGPRAKQFYDQCRFRDMQGNAQQILARDGILPGETTQRLGAPARLGASDPAFAHLSKNFAMGDSYMEARVMGICNKQMAKGDFVHAMYLCEAWTEKFKPDGAEKTDKTSEEAKHERGDD